MESKDKLKEIDIKNRTCYYFHDIIKDYKKKLYENISVYGISYKTLMGPKPLRIRFNKIDGFMRVCGGKFRYLVLFDYGLFDKMFDRNKYLIGEKSGITESINHNFGRIIIDSYDSLPIEKILTFHNVVILISQFLIRIK